MVEEGVLLMDCLVQVGAVRAFDPLPPGRETARKLVEEAAEAFSAWEDWGAACGDAAIELGEARHEGERTTPGLARARRVADAARGHLMLELSDVVQAVANMAAEAGVTDMRPLMAACEARNAARGRIGRSRR